MATLSVANSWSDVSARVKNIGDVSTTQQLRLASIVNREIREALLDVDPEQLISTSTISVVANTASYTLPTDFQSLEAIGCGMYLVDTNGKDTDTKLAITSFGSEKKGFYLNATSIVMTPIPASSETYKFRYIATISDFAVDTENFVVGDRFRECVRTGLLVQYYWQKNGSKDTDYMNWSAEYAKRMDDMQDWYRRLSDTVGVQDISNNY